MSELVCTVKSLPMSLQDALATHGYHRKDITVKVREKESLSQAGSSGSQAITVLVDLSTGETKTLVGSWGGSNMFNPSNRVDMDTESRVLGMNLAVIKLSKGDHPTYGTITIGPSNVLAALPAKPSLSLIQRQVLYCFNSLKSGPYRQQELSRLGSAVMLTITELIALGLLKKDGRGIAITTDGKNAVAGLHSMPREEKE